ncbi:hypothetical protein AQ490_15745 [Wenjunlia vitaminophila]|uniref:Chaplin domain-containing protein n=1 Tax=Wenjunlia vitaminophila TaxID=76728 RepID=A0A0T6LXR6_WENVI|nr:chaplin [Wenjunlia vitaminophila]KRV50527.1 hypothetical protein AQ490_15745 [Wenjunlia vitaminophila]
MSRIAKAAVLAAATGLALSGSAGVAAADSGSEATVSHSPGFLSGNAVQANLPVDGRNLTDDVLSLLNTTQGSTRLQDGGQLTAHTTAHHYYHR